MDLVQTTQLLVLISQYNGMKIDDAKVIAWYDMVGDLEFEEAAAGVKYHFRNSTDWLQPGHLFAAVKAARTARKEQERINEARMRSSVPAIEARSTAGLTEAQKRELIASPEKTYLSPVARQALAQMREETAPSRPGALKVAGSVSSDAERGLGAQRGNEPGGKGPSRLGSLFGAFSRKVQGAGDE